LKFKIQDYLYPTLVLAHHQRMKSAPDWSPDRLAEWSTRRRKAILAHAYENVPYYRRLFDEHGIRPDEIDHPEVWRRIPTLDKNTLRSNSEALTASGKYSRGAVWASTSGSTGMPLKVLLDQQINSAAFALFWRAWSSGGYWRIGQRQAALKGLHNESGWRYNRTIRTLELSSVRFDRKAVHLYHDLIRRFQPHFLRGYPSSMYIFCRLLKEEGLDLHVPMIISGSEMLHDFQRSMIESTLGGRVYNHYTHWERAASILECDLGRLHAQEDYGYHEILDLDGNPVPPGVVGEITVTGLYNLAMPLIRYRTGDLASWSGETCACGQSFPVVEQIAGRQNDFIVSPSGELTSGTSAVFGLKLMPQILYFQLIQRQLGNVEVYIVRARDYRDPQDTNRVRELLHDRLGPDTNLSIRFCSVEELERNPVGKIRSCINHLPAEALARFSLPESKDGEEGEVFLKRRASNLPVEAASNR
jgi:phenylacetate-CoA ligase